MKALSIAFPIYTIKTMTGLWQTYYGPIVIAQTTSHEAALAAERLLQHPNARLP